MSPTIAVSPDVTTHINVLTVEPGNQTKLVELLREHTERVVTTLPGWISTSMAVSHDRRRVLIYSQWRDPASIQAMQSHPQMRSFFPRIAALAAFDSITCDMTYTRHA